MKFAQPEYLWVLLVALPLLGGLFFWSWRVKQKLIAQFIPARLLPGLTVGVSAARQKFRLFLLGAAVAGILLALARPQWGVTWIEAKQRGLDIVVAVDTSRSMLATDVAPNRLERAKLAAFDLMRQAKEDRLGVVAFAGGSFLTCPLTLDDEAFRQSVEALDVGIIKPGGTSLSGAIETAQEAFEKGNDNHKVLVLFTDGEDHDIDTNTLSAAEEAARSGMKIFTVGVGTPAGELLREQDDQGNTVFIKDDDGNVVKSRLDEGLLEKIATIAGGFYLPLRGANPMQVLYERGLAPLPKSESTTKLTRVPQERYHWPLGFAIVCLLVEFLMPERSRSGRGATTAAAVNPGLEKMAAALLVLMIPLAARASTPGAFDKYNSGDFKAAYEEYSRLAEQNTNDYRLHYNAGTAAYQAKDLEAAEKQLGAALNSPEIISDLPTQERTYFNLGNTLYHLGEPLPDPDKKKERWEQAAANFSRALQLNTNDVDARNNLAFVKKKLEELKQQQQQKKQQQQKQDNSKDQDQKNQDQKNQDQKNQQNQQQKDAAAQDQKNKKDQAGQKQAQKSDQDKQKEGQQQAQGNKDQKDQTAQAKANASDQRDKSSDQNEQGEAAMPAQMTPQQARQMLDAQRDDEKALIFSPENQQVKTVNGKIKDW